MMMNPPKLITDTSEIAAAEWIPAEEPGDISTDITAMETAVGKPFELPF